MKKNIEIKVFFLLLAAASPGFATAAGSVECSMSWQDHGREISSGWQAARWEEEHQERTAFGQLDRGGEVTTLEFLRSSALAAAASAKSRVPARKDFSERDRKMVVRLRRVPASEGYHFTGRWSLWQEEAAGEFKELLDGGSEGFVPYPKQAKEEKIEDFKKYTDETGNGFHIRCRWRGQA